MKTTVHTLSISHRHGVNLSVHPSKAALDADLFQYVADYWDDEIGVTEKMPDDPAEACSRYFDLVEDEFCAIESHTIEIWEPKDSMTALLTDAIEAWPQFDADVVLMAPGPIPDEIGPEVDGGDMVEWFGEWRDRAKQLLAKVEG